MHAVCIIGYNMRPNTRILMLSYNYVFVSRQPLTKSCLEATRLCNKNSNKEGTV